MASGILNKKVYKNIKLWNILVIITAVIVIANSQGFLGSVAVEDLQYNNYKLAMQQYQTIKCISENPDNYYIYPYRNSISDDEDDFGYTRIDSECVTKVIELTDAKAQGTTSGTLGFFQYAEIKDSFTGTSKCYESGSIISGGDECSGIDLTYGQTYEFCTNANDVVFEVTGNRPYLEYQNPDATGFLPIPGTQNCILQDWIKNVRDEFNAISGSVEADTNIPSASQNPRKNEMGSALDIGQGFRVAYAYDEKATIPIYSYNGNLVYCDAGKNPPQVIEYELILGQWVIPGDNVVVTGDKTCCNSWMCQNYWNLGEGWFCNSDFKCEQGEGSGQSCWNDNDCEDSSGANFFTQGNQDYMIIGECVGATSSSQGQCETTHKEIECRPDRTYGDECCFYDDVDGSYYLDWCESPTRECPSGMCCEDSQTSYTPRTCAQGISKGVVASGAIECCGAEDDGIGVCKAECDAGNDLSNVLLNKIIDGLKEFLSGLGFDLPFETVKWILIGIAVIFVIMLFKGGGSRKVVVAR